MPQPQQIKIAPLAKLKSGRFIRLDQVLSTETEHGRLTVHLPNAVVTFQGEDATDVAQLLAMVAGLVPSDEDDALPALLVPDKKIVLQ